MKYFGSRAEVMHGLAQMTTGRLTKKDLTYSKDGKRIYSKKQVKAAKKNPGLKAWRSAVKTAKCQLGLPQKGQGAFVPIKGNLKNRAKNISRCGCQ